MRIRIASTVVAIVLTASLAAHRVRAQSQPQDESAVPQAKEPTAPQPSPTPEKKPATPPDKSPISPPDQPVTPQPDKAPDKANPLKAPARPEPLRPAGPSTRPATAESEFPTPAELIKRLQAQKAQKAKMSKVVHFDLASPIVEKPADFSLFADTQTTLRSLIERMQMARDDKDVRGVILTLGEPSLNFAQAQELRDALVELRQAGKKTFVYADGYDTVGYTVATGATDVCLMQGGEIMIPGVGMETTFYKGLFDKIGVQADYVQIGEYKGAEEPYTRTGPSEALKGELNKLADSMYQQIVEGIAANRNVSSDSVKQLIDETIVTAKVAKDRGFVDHLVDMDGLRKLMSDEIGNDAGLDIVSNYGRPDREEMDFSSPFALLASLTKKPEPTNKPAVALVYAEGTIVDGDGGEGLLSSGNDVGSATIRKALRKAASDNNVKAVVIRIDSPGGSAQASEVMWQAARVLAEKKPVIISIGSMAASGGYYLASAGDYIFADPSAIVGSIGVVGGKFVLKDIYGKLGINTEAFGRGRNSDLFSSTKPFDERQKRLITNWMKGTYEQFTQRVMTTRKGKIKDIDQVARGRIFIAKQAKDLGMVDEIGGVQAALAYAANKVDLKPGTYDVKLLPTPRTLADLLGGGGAEAAMPFTPKIEVEALAVLKALDPTTRKALGQQLEMIQLLQHRPVVLLAPFTMTVR